MYTYRALQPPPAHLPVRLLSRMGHPDGGFADARASPLRAPSLQLAASMDRGSCEMPFSDLQARPIWYDAVPGGGLLQQAAQYHDARVARSLFSRWLESTRKRYLCATFSRAVKLRALTKWSMAHHRVLAHEQTAVWHRNRSILWRMMRKGGAERRLRVSNVNFVRQQAHAVLIGWKHRHDQVTLARHVENLRHIGTKASCFSRWLTSARCRVVTPRFRMRGPFVAWLRLTRAKHHLRASRNAILLFRCLRAATSTCRRENTCTYLRLCDIRAERELAACTAAFHWWRRVHCRAVLNGAICEGLRERRTLRQLRLLFQRWQRRHNR